jgi:hypothetical protein
MVVWGWESRLCVEMKRGRFAKEGLIQYRIVCQQVNVASLEEVRRVLPLTAASPVCRLSVACTLSDAELPTTCGQDPVPPSACAVDPRLLPQQSSHRLFLLQLLLCQRPRQRCVGTRWRREILAIFSLAEKRRSLLHR